jgi:hypothetical protein
MKGFLSGAILTCLLIACFPLTTYAQDNFARKEALRARRVSLETILSCADDPLIEAVFNTDSETARSKLNGVLMMEAKFRKVELPDYDFLRLKGFVTDLIDDSHVSIVPTDIHTGSAIPERALTFCLDFPTASYGKSSNSGPSLVTISGMGWRFDPNEVFLHANQFHFDSGVFADSTDVYLTATKGRTTIQFIAKPAGLTLYRVLIAPSE